MRSNPRYLSKEVERNSEGIRYTLEFPAASGLFLGHFPGNPILPGVAQVQVCTEVMGQSLSRELTLRELESVRFRKPVLPDTTCELTVTLPDADGRVAFRFTGPDGVIADGRLLLAEEIEKVPDA